MDTNQQDLVAQFVGITGANPASVSLLNSSGQPDCPFMLAD